MGVFDGIANIGVGFASMSHAEKMQDRNFRFQEDMWRKNNEYNDPANVASRLVRAGFNPAMANDLPISPSVAPSGGTGSPGAVLGASFGNIGLQYSQARAVERSSEADANLKDAQAEDLRNRMPYNAESARLGSDLMKVDLLDKRMDVAAKTIGDYYQENAKRPAVENQHAVADAIAKQASAALDRYRLEHTEPAKVFQLLSSSLSQAELNDHLGKEADARSGHFDAMAVGQRLSNKQQRLEYDAFKQFYDEELEVVDPNTGKPVKMTGKDILMQEKYVRDGIVRSQLQNEKWVAEHPILSRALGSIVGGIGAAAGWLFKSRYNTPRGGKFGRTPPGRTRSAGAGIEPDGSFEP